MIGEGKLSLSHDSTIIFNKMTRCQDTVYTFGGYIRRFVNETRAQGGIPVLFTLTPRNAREKDSDKIQRKLTDFTPAIFSLGQEMKVWCPTQCRISGTGYRTSCS